VEVSGFQFDAEQIEPNTQPKPARRTQRTEQAKRTSERQNMPPRFVYNDDSLERSVALTATVSGLTQLTYLTENADALSAVTDQSGSPLLRMRDKAKRTSFELMDSIGLGDSFAKRHEEEESRASSSKLESYLSKKRRSKSKGRTDSSGRDQKWQRQTPKSSPQSQIQHPRKALTSEEYKATLLASSEYMSFDDNSVLSRKHHANRAQGWFPWESDALGEQVGGHLDRSTDAPERPARSNPAGVAHPGDHAHRPEGRTGILTAFVKTARTLLGRCHVLMDEHDVDGWTETASITFRKTLRAGRAQCVASCNAAAS